MNEEFSLKKILPHDVATDKQNNLYDCDHSLQSSRNCYDPKSTYLHEDKKE